MKYWVIVLLGWILFSGSVGAGWADTPRTSVSTYPCLTTSLVTELKTIGVVTGTQILQTKIYPQRNHLGQGFGKFFLHPRPFTKTESDYLNSWKKEQSLWWRTMDNTSKNKSPRIGIDTQGLFQILPLIGKSQILLAAEDWENHQPQSALHRLAYLQNELKNIKRQIPEPLSPYQNRVLTELSRISKELQQAITTSSRKLKEPAHVP